MKKTGSSRQFFRSLEADALNRRPFLIRVSDELTAWCGSTTFLILNLAFFIAWIMVNTYQFPGITQFDPYPFGFLTMAVSLEAIVLSIFVLISQNRSSYTSMLRDEVQLQVNLISEQEITKILQILSEMRKQMGIIAQDAELESMIQRINEIKIEKDIENQITEANRNLITELRKDLPGFFKRSQKTS